MTHLLKPRPLFASGKELLRYVPIRGTRALEVPVPGMKANEEDITNITAAQHDNPNPPQSPLIMGEAFFTESSVTRWPRGVGGRRNGREAPGLPLR